MQDQKHPSQKVDDLDIAIINCLERDGRLPNTELAKKLNTSEATIRKRIKRLIDEGFIRVMAIRNRSKLGYLTDGNIRIKADTRKTKAIIDELSRLDGLWYIAQLTGAADFDLEFSVRSPDDLRELLEKVNGIDGVLNTEVSFRLQLIKQYL